MLQGLLINNGHAYECFNIERPYLCRATRLINKHGVRRNEDAYGGFEIQRGHDCHDQAAKNRFRSSSDVGCMEIMETEVPHLPGSE